VTTSAGEPFANQGACVSYVARGGALGDGVVSPPGFSPPDALGPQPTSPPDAPGVPFVDCGVPNGLMTVSKLIATPLDTDRVEIGLYGTLAEVVTTGTAELRLAADGVVVADRSLALATLTTLPALPGPVLVRAVLHDLPDDPSVVWTLQVDLFDQNRNQLSCITTTLTP
jgi:hypothetical protein